MNATTTRCFLLVLTVGLATGVMGGATLRSGDASSLQSTSDWPMYRHDAQRSAATAEQLALPLKLAWSYTCLQPPAPAWPDTFPQDLLNRMDFDYAPQLAIAEGIVCFGSSADDTMCALDVKTGKERWHFITGGPVRFAPQIVSNRVYFASDDGYVYCLNAQTGRGIWKFRAAPADERFVGNHRMISRWPIRTGVLVDSGVVYAVAGMWPAEGVFGYALAADTGKVLWCNDTLGGTPQGALLASRDILLVPNGNARTTPLNRHTGELMRWGSSNDPSGWLAGTYKYIPADPRTGKPVQHIYRGGGSGRGGTWVAVDDDKEYSFVMHRANQLDIEPYSLTNGLAGEGWKVGQQLTIAPGSLPGYIHARGKVSAILHKGRSYTRQAYGMALAGNMLFLGHDGAVTAEPTNKADTNKIGAATAPWQAKVDGEAREIAVAEGRLFVSTSEGVIYCFAPAGEKTEFRSQKSGGKSQEAKSGFADSNQSESGKRKSEITLLLQQAGMDRGFALVLGDSDGQMSLALAEQTHLQVINALTNASAVAALRERLLATTAWYGSRIHVQHVARLDALPFAQYFANAVIVADALSGLSGAELYRVLRPCGGIMLFPGLNQMAAQALVKTSGAAEKEIQSLSGAVTIVRGKLPGALDWDTGGKPDQRAKLPLRHLWFGGPSTRQVQEFIQKGAGPTLANGRSFTIGEDSLTAVDAYNGAVLWSRPIPKCYFNIRSVAGALYSVADRGGKYGRPGRGELVRGLHVSDDYVYLTLGAYYFKGKGQGTIQLDARTGEQKHPGVPFNPPVPVSLKTPQSWSLGVDANHNGAVTMAAATNGLFLTLVTADPLVTPLDAWELFFDFRPAAERYGLYEPGVFHVRVAPARDPAMRDVWQTGGGTGPASGGTGTATPASWSPITAWSSRNSVGRHTRLRQGYGGQGMTAPSVTVPVDSTTPLYPQLKVSGTREPTGTKTTVLLPWKELEQLTGAKPSSFDFAAALNAHDGGTNEPIVRCYLFGDWMADGLNNGWASVSLGAELPATNKPAIMTAAFQDARGSGAGIYGHYNTFAAGYYPPTNYAPGTHPLTGEPVPKIYWWDAGCGIAYYSANFLAGQGRILDLADNSGGRNLPLRGVKTGCTTPMVVALGMLLVSEETGHCVCNYPFRGSLALAPAERRLNEDWASFYERDVDTLVRQAHLNFGAPGDRRDEQGNLWLGFPRADDIVTPEDFPNPGHGISYPMGMRDALTGLWYRRALRGSVGVPLAVETVAGFAPYHLNTDRFAIRGTDRPWIYGSGYRGIRKAVLKLNFFKPLVARLAPAPPTVDGRLNEPTWQPELSDTNNAPLLPYTLTRVFFRYDSRALYVGLQRPPITKKTHIRQVNGTGAFIREQLPWQTGRSRPDELSRSDNWWRLIVSDSRLGGSTPANEGKKTPPALHFAVAADGTRAEAFARPAMGGAGPAEGGAGATTNALDWTWNPAWQSAVQTNEQGWTLEMAIPFSTLEQAGLKKDQLAVNFMMNDPGLGSEALTYLGMEGFDNCSNFTPLGFGAPVPPAPRSFTIRLHFAEPDNIVAGQRVFAVKLQGQTVLKDFDILKEAKAPLTALVKEFKGVRAAEALTLEFVPAAQVVRPENAPIFCGLELAEEPAIGK